MNVYHYIFRERGHNWARDTSLIVVVASETQAFEMLKSKYPKYVPKYWKLEKIIPITEEGLYWIAVEKWDV